MGAWQPALREPKLHPFVRGSEPQALIKRDGLGTALVTGQLHEVAVTLPCLVNGPLHQLGAVPRSTVFPRHAHAFDQRPGDPFTDIGRVAAGDILDWLNRALPAR